MRLKFESRLITNYYGNYHLIDFKHLLTCKPLAFTFLCDCAAGKPIGELEYPAITICSQGWIKEVIDSVIEHQKSEFAAEKNLDVTDDGFEEMFWNDKYAGLSGSPRDLVSMMVSSDPEQTVASQALVHKDPSEFDENVVIVHTATTATADTTTAATTTEAITNTPTTTGHTVNVSPYHTEALPQNGIYIFLKSHSSLL